jgi:methionyl aminopeptidase
MLGMGKAARLKRDRRNHADATGPTRLVRPGTISPWLPVPAEIPRPDYAETGEPKGRRDGSLIKTPEQIEHMRHAGKAAGEVLALLEQYCQPGVTTDEIDRVAHEAYIARGGYPSTLNYHGYPKSLCTSVNEVICHGIPDSRMLEDGDIVNCDVTIFLEGVHGDCSATYLVGNVDAESRRLVTVTKECLDLGIAAVKPGRPISDIGLAIQKHAEAAGFGVVRAFVGHGIGETFHMEPSVPHYYEARMDLEMRPGMTFTIEPMITAGDHRHDTWRDGWTAVTRDRRRTAQFEHTLLVTDDGVEILTLP